MRVLTRARKIGLRPFRRSWGWARRELSRFGRGAFEFHISCCGRSGSKFVAAAIRNMGVPVLHEMGDDWPFPQERGIRFIAENPEMFALYRGIVGWKWSLLTPELAERPRLQFHLVRSPLRAIESATTHADSLFDFIERRLGKPDFETAGLDEAQLRLGRAVHYWVRYNDRFGRDKVTIRLEEFVPGGASFETFCDALAIPKASRELAGFVQKDLNTRRNAKRRVPADLATIREVFPDYSESLERLASQYRYSL